MQEVRPSQEPLTNPEAQQTIPQPPKFLFSLAEAQKMKAMLPKQYSFIKKSTLDKVKQKKTLLPYEISQIGRIRFAEKKKVSNFDDLYPWNTEPVIYPNFEGHVFGECKEEYFCEVTSGDMFGLKRAPVPEVKKILPKKKLPPKTRQQKDLEQKCRRDAQISKMRVLQVIGPGRLPEFDVVKYLQEKEKEKKKKIQQQQNKQQPSEIKEKKDSETIIKSMNEKDAVDTIIQQLLVHPSYFYLMESQMTPSMLCFQKMLIQRKNRNYSINEVQKDLKDIFETFYKSSNANNYEVNEVKNFESYIDKKMSKMKSKLGVRDKSKEKLQKQFEKMQVSQAYSTVKKQNISSRGRIRKNRFYQFDPEKVNKHSKLSRQKIKQYSLHQRQTLGKNILQLPSQQLQHFLVRFGLLSVEKNYEGGTSFVFDINKISADRCDEIEGEVRNILSRHNMNYVDLLQSEIQSDVQINDSENEHEN